MSDDLKERLSDMSVLSQSRTPADALKHIEELEAALSEQIQWVRELADDLIAAEGREAKLKTKLAKKDGCLEETYRRWKNGADLRVLAKAEGCTQERMRHKMKRYEEDKVRLLEAKLINAMYEVATYSNDPHLVKWARKSLAELKGETDE